MNRKIVLGAIVLASTVLAGCASNARVDAVEGQLNSINAKLDGLSAQIETAIGEAKRANDRLDNMQKKSYTK
ncbi:LPP leucine zipper domain-containing protein [Thorsellia anophelis]|uniref:Major outer membrane lipoprotein Lpp n=1 Tax=Thorsellia anophelis DSM 18579 TaxID=1123402 RepID=A0A1I0B3D6_9GAMM|nr:LPP leucine zipper domain-containing protein [Thorsellia anophelis]SET00881.1 murein lipoprotein [Thorsellia anophelis DSM 18579]